MHGVLVVDDHEPFRAYARRLLAESGFQVAGEAADGSSALRAVARYRPELVLLDVRLPDMSGIEVARRILAGPDAPAVILVSTADPGDYQQLAVELGARGFITKSDLTASRLRTMLTL